MATSLLSSGRTLHLAAMLACAAGISPPPAFSGQMPAQAEEVIATPQITRLRSILGQVIEEFRADNEEVRNLVEGLGRSYGLPILLDPEINGRVTFALYQSPLNTILDAICAPYGWSWTIEPAGYVIVNRFETKIYRIDYLPVTQTGTSSASVNLTGSSSGGSDSASGGSSSSSNGTSGGNSSGSSSSGGSSLSVAQSTEADFWGRYEKDIAAMLTKDETAIINKFGGVLQVKASRQTHARIESYSHSLMERVRRQVFISVQIVRVDLTNSRQFGVDWNVAAFDLGNDRNSPQIGGNFALPGQQISGRGLAGSTNVTTAGALSLPAPTFAGVIQAGKVSALVRALQQQGNVKIETKPEIATLNNVPAFVQISEDRSFFRRSSETNFNQGTTTNGSPPVTDVTYEERVVSFGNVLEVVPQISDANEVQLALQPAITDLRGVDFSPDGESNAPRQGVSRLRSVVTLRDGETYIMGGFISEQQGNTSRRIPVLGSIPVLGAAFRTDGTISERSEIVVLVSVRVRQPEASAPSLVKPTAPGPAVRAVLPTPTPTPPAVVRAPVARPAPPVSEIPPAPPVSEPPPAVPEPPVAPEVVEEVPVATSSSVPVTGFSP